MKIGEWLNLHKELDEKEFWRKVSMQYRNASPDRELTYYMVWMDKPFWMVEKMYDIAYERFDGKDNPFRNDDCATRIDTTYAFMVERKYNEDEARWIEDEFKRIYGNP